MSSPSRSSMPLSAAPAAGFLGAAAYSCTRPSSDPTATDCPSGETARQCGSWLSSMSSPTLSASDLGSADGQKHTLPSPFVVDTNMSCPGSVASAPAAEGPCTAKVVVVAGSDAIVSMSSGWARA